MTGGTIGNHPGPIPSKVVIYYVYSLNASKTRASSWFCFFRLHPVLELC